MFYFYRLEGTKEGMFYLSSSLNGIELSMIDRKFRVTAETSTRKWVVMTSDVDVRTWMYLEVTWSMDDGLQVYSNNVLLKEDTSPSGIDKMLFVFKYDSLFLILLKLRKISIQ